MKKLLAASVLIFLAITLMHAPAFAQDDEVVIIPYRWDQSTIVFSDQFITLQAGWAACKKGPLQAFRSATHISWTLDKEGVQVDSGEVTRKYWGPIHYIPLQAGVCLGKTPETIPAITWSFPLGQLEAGEYSLHFYWWLDHPVTDLGDNDGNGRPDFFSGTIKDVDISIHVIDR